MCSADADAAKTKLELFRCEKCDYNLCGQQSPGPTPTPELSSDDPIGRLGSFVLLPTPLRTPMGSAEKALRETCVVCVPRPLRRGGDEDCRQNCRRHREGQGGRSSAKHGSLSLSLSRGVFFFKTAISTTRKFRKCVCWSNTWLSTPLLHLLKGRCDHRTFFCRLIETIKLLTMSSDAYLKTHSKVMKIRRRHAVGRIELLSRGRFA